MHVKLRPVLSLVLLLAIALLAACAAAPPAETTPPESSAAPAAEETRRPPFAAHVPFLFADERGFVRPEDPLRADELAAALAALCPDGGEIALPEGAEIVTGEALRACLRAVLSEEELRSFPEEGELSRADFAVGVCRVLGSGEGESVLPAAGALAPVDLPTDAPYYAAVLEASVPHSEGGSAGWAEAGLETGYEPGVLRLDGELYACGEDGRLLKNAALGPLCFDENGRYSSGDPELDELVSTVLDDLREMYPRDADDSMAMLRHAYDFVRDSFTNDGESGHTDGEGWELRDGKRMLETLRGGCFESAAGFTVLARGLGFQAYGVLCPLLGESEDHAWTDIVVDYVPYVFDPLLDSRYRDGRFQLDYKHAERCGYRRPLDTPGAVCEPDQLLAWTPPTERGELVAELQENGLVFLVYLPYGYDESKQYNVLIYLYGGDGNPYRILGATNTYSHQNRYLGHYFTTPDYVDFLTQRGDCSGVIYAATNTTFSTGNGDRYIELLQYVVDNYSTYAESSALEDLIAAREHFGIAGPSSASQGLCLCLPNMPDVFGTVGLFSGITRLDGAVEGLAQKGHIRLVMGVGELESIYSTVTKAYERFSELENVEAYLWVFPNAGHEWSAFDATLRQLLFLFAPAEK